MLKIFFKDNSGTIHTFSEKEGLTILQIAHKYGIDIEGACEGNLACSTCHVVVEEKWYKKIPPPKEEEEDMLDLAYGLTETSRLGCQLVLSADLDGLEVRLPISTRDARVL